MAKVVTLGRLARIIDRMDISNLIHSLTVDGFTLSVDKGQLKITGPVERLSKNQKQSLQHHKRVLLDVVSKSHIPSEVAKQDSKVSSQEDLAEANDSFEEVVGFFELAKDGLHADTDPLENLIDLCEDVVSMFDLRERFAKDCEYGYQWTKHKPTYDYIRYCWRNRLRKVVQ